MDSYTMLKAHTLIVSLLLTRFIPVSMEGNRCSGGHDLYVDIKENSPNGTVIAKLTINGNLSSHEISLNLTGTDMEWFRLEEEVVKLNVLPARQLDRELLSTPLLFATITCTDVATSDQIHYRLMVQVLDENDNPPMFLKESVQQVNISELTQVGNVVFTLQANDRDGDDLIYVIDGATSDAEFFIINLPSSGKVQLAKQLDFEVKKELELMVYAMEVNTKERYNTTAKININVLDGDDQYPRFLPCNFLSHGASRICVNPIYTGNVTESKLLFHALQLSPGSVLAEDGDIGLRTPVIYSILEGGDNGRFEINNITGALMMRWPVRSYIQNPSFSLTVMASQVDDSSKYTVTKVLIRVLVQNRHRPRFNKIEYKGFVQEQPNPFALVVTYGNKPLLVKAVDQDFKNGRNPKLTYTLTNQSNHTQLYQVTQEGLLLARTNRLHAHEKYMLQIVGIDNESGDMVSTKVNVEVLHSSQPVPSGLPKESRMHSSKEVGLLGGIIAILFLLLVVAFILLVYNLRRRQKQHRQTGTVAVERNTNVRLKWFQLINTSKPEQSCRNLAYINEAFSSCNEESNNGGATYNQANISHELLDAAPIQEQECTIKPILTNGKLTSCKFICVKADVMAEEISTDAGHQYTECNNEEQRVNSNCPIGVNFQLPSMSGLEERPQWASKKEPLEVIKKTLQEAAGQAGTVPEEIKGSVSTEKQDLKAYMTEEQEYSISSTGLADLMTARGKKQSVSEAIQEYPATTSREQGHIIYSKKRASVVDIMAGDAISEGTVRAKNLVALEQPAAEEHPLVETQPVIEVTVEHPVEVPYRASTDHPVKIENTVATMSLASSEYPVVVQHPVEMEDLGVTRLQVTKKMTTEYPAATEYSVSEDIVFYCPMTGVTIEVLEGAEEMEDTATIKEIVETSVVVTKCPVAEDGIEQLMTEGLAIEGQSITQLDAEDPSAEGSTIKGPEGETPTEGQLEGNGSLSAAGTDLELSEVVSIDSAAKETSLETTRHPEPDMVRDCSVVPMGSTDTDYSAAVERGDSSVTLGENTTNMVML